MPVAGLLDYLPLWGVFGVTVVLVVLAIEGGYRLGLARRLRAADEMEALVGAISTARARG